MVEVGGVVAACPLLRRVLGGVLGGGSSCMGDTRVHTFLARGSGERKGGL